MEYESYNTGTLLYIGAEAGQAVPVNGVLAIIGEKGADWETLLKAHQSKEGSSSPSEDKQDAPAKAESGQRPVESVKETPSAVQSSDSNGRIKASPLAKSMAKEKGYDISKITGTGDHGRVTKRDVENYSPSAAPAGDARADKAIVLPSVVGEEKFEDVALSQMRKTIARRLSESKFTSPHFYLTMEINMDKAVAARKSINEVSPVKISFNDIVLKAAASALRQHPDVNVSWLGDKMRKNQHIHIGVAVAVKDGLIVPV